MAKVKLKNEQTGAPVEEFLAGVEHPKRREDAQALLQIFNKVTKMPAKLWGSAMVGYGRYEYRYASGREGEYFMTGFSPRKQNLAIYIMPGYQDLSDYLDRLACEPGVDPADSRSTWM